MSSSHLPIKIIQFGKGNFLRGFSAWIIDFLNKNKNFNGGIQIVETFKTSKSDYFFNQNFRYNVVEQGIENQKVIDRHIEINSIIGLTNVVNEFDQFLKLAREPELQFIISNTTESGIIFNSNDSDIHSPQTYPGRLTALLFNRFKFLGVNTKKIYVLPCELIDNNADELLQCVKMYVDMWKLPPSFISWLNDTVYFCNTLVDRIVSGYPKNVNAYRNKLGFDDKLIVVCEPYHFWAIEDKAGLSDFFPIKDTHLNVRFVDDIRPYKDLKVRILNGAHTAMVSLGMVNGIETVEEFMSNISYKRFLDEMLTEEVFQTLSKSEIELLEFKNSVFDRFQNPFIKHQLSAIQLNSISKFRTRLLPSLKDYITINNAVPKHISEVLAHLLWLYKNGDIKSFFLLKDDPRVFEIFNKAWGYNDLNKTVHTLLQHQKLWGEDLSLISGLQKSIVENMSTIAHKFKIKKTF